MFQQPSQADISSIYGRFVDPDGGIGDLMEIASDDYPKTFPQVAFDGNEFLVVWQDGRNGGIHGARVTEVGTVLDPEGIPIVSGTNSAFPAVAGGCNRFYVAWREEGLDNLKDIRAARIDHDGTTYPPFYVATDQDKGTPPSLTFGYGLYLASWGALPVAPQFVIRSRTWDPEGNLGAVIEVGRPDEEGVWMSACPGPFDFNVCWSNWDFDIPSDVVGQRLNPSGVVVGPRVDLATNMLHSSQPDVTCNGERFLTVWDDGEGECYICGDTTNVWQDHFWAQHEYATAYNQGRHLAKDPVTGLLHMAYWSNDSIFYSYSMDDGQHWRPYEFVGSGSTPCIVCEGQGPNPVWICYTSARNVVCKARLGLGNWEEYTLYEGGEATTAGAPSMSMCYAPGPINRPTVYVTFAVSTAQLSSIEFCRVALHVGVEGWYTVDGPSSAVRRAPSIATTPGDVVHIVWQRDDMERIYYKQLYSGQWSDTAGVSNDLREPSAEPASWPCVEAYGGKVYVVWRGRDRGNNPAGDVWRRSKFVAPFPRFLEEPKDQSRTEGQASAYPQNSRDLASVWQEEYLGPPVSWDIWVNVCDQVIPMWHDCWPARFPSVVAEPSEPGEPPAIMVNTLWTNYSHAGGLAPYEVKFMRYMYIPPTDEPPDLSYYNCTVGDSAGSRFCLARDGFARWRNYAVDLGRESLCYRMPYLNPNYDYKLRAVVFHASKDTWEQGLALDRERVARVRFRPLVPETIFVAIPRRLYERDCEVRLDITRLSGGYAAVADLRLYECYPYKHGGGDGTQTIGTSSAPIEAPRVAASPNPFRRYTAIAYSVATTGPISISVFNSQGRLVRRLVSGARGPRLHTVLWNGTDDRARRVAAGTYFLRLESGSLRQTKKVVLAE